MTLPTAVGAAGQQLTDAAGDGVCSWAAAGSLREIKEFVGGLLDPTVALQRILAAPVELWRYKQGHGTGDHETIYAGVVADKAPWAMHFGGAIFSPVSAAGHAYAAIQALWAENVDLRSRVTRLEARFA